MTQDEIIEMAMEAEFVSHGKPSEEESELFVCVDKDIYKFAELVAAKEREACAKVCDEVGEHPSLQPRHCAESIRARGQA
jgi:hypothetical protein